jgi:hypothetical protein
MKRAVTSVLAPVLIASVCVVGTPRTATADTEVCAGIGTAQLSGPVYYPGFGPPANGGFNLGFLIGACSSSGDFRATGGYGGPLGGAYCGLSTGGGVANGHHSYAWIEAGGIVIVFGGVDGVWVYSPNVLAGQSCVSGVTQFLVTGAVVLI